MKELLKKAARCEEGQDLIEYSLLIGIITVASMLAMAVCWVSHSQVIQPTVIRLTTRRIIGAASTTTGNIDTHDSAHAFNQRPAKARSSAWGVVAMAAATAQVRPD